MFILDGKPLSPDRAFTHAGIQYPANWLRLSSPEQRTAIGITEAPDDPIYDQRFYWGVGNPKDHNQLVEQWIGQIKATAASLLDQTDWYITRASETGVAAPQHILDRRSDIRKRSNDKEALLTATTSTEELAAYVTSQAFTAWEDLPVVETVVEIGTTSEATTTSTPISGTD